MEDKISDLLAQYDLAVYRAGRVKGAWILETDKGLKHLGPYSYSEGKATFEQKVKQFAAEHGFPALDLYVENKEQCFLVQGSYNEQFIMRNWFYGEECDAKDREHVLKAVRTLARLHNCLKGFTLPAEEQNFCLQPKVPVLMERRNKELRRVRAYIRSKKQKSIFEQKFLTQFDAQAAKAEEASALLDISKYENYYNNRISEGCMLHGNFTHHSVLLLSEGGMAVTGFDKVVTGIQIHDFYQLFRKIMEKWDWDVSLGDSMLGAYQSIRPIPEEEWELLKVLLIYPEKFWKVANRYYNNRKCWIPEKNMQKLLQTMEQAEKKEESIKMLFT